MAKFDTGELIRASDIVALKASVKAEMLRRNKTGSLAEYGGTNWDFTIAPLQGVAITNEHYNKIRQPVGAINVANLPPESVSQYPSLTELDARLTINKNQTGKSSTTHGCMASCSGLCFNSCTSCSGCDGCSGCGWCDYGCFTGCDGCSGCSGCSGCGGACSNSCSGGCDSACGGCGSGCYVCSPTMG